MNAGLPIIASNVGGVSEQVENRVNGFLISPGNKEELKEKMIEFLKDNSKIKKMGQASHKKLKEKFSLQKLHQRTCQVYKEVLSKK